MTNELKIPKYCIGDPVTVTDQDPRVEGKIVECSTWGTVLTDESDDVCYRVECELWSPKDRWIDEGFICLRRSQNLKLNYAHCFESMKKDE
jgi:hypothetical protein